MVVNILEFVALVVLALLVLSFVWVIYRIHKLNSGSTRTLAPPISPPSEIRDLTMAVQQLVSVLPVVVEEMTRDRFNLRTVALAVPYDESDKLILYRLPRGEYKNQWQFIGGYSLPLRDARPKAEEEIMREFGLQQNELQLIGWPTRTAPLIYNHSNPGTNFAQVYEYRIPPQLLERVLHDKGLLCKIVEYHTIEHVQLDPEIALYVYDFFEKYKAVKYSSAFQEDLRRRREKRIRENERISTLAVSVLGQLIPTAGGGHND